MTTNRLLGDDVRDDMHPQCHNVGGADFLALMLSRRQFDRGVSRRTVVLIDRITGEAYSASELDLQRLAS